MAQKPITVLSSSSEHRDWSYPERGMGSPKGLSLAGSFMFSVSRYALNKTMKIDTTIFELWRKVALFLIIFFAILTIFISEDLESTLITLAFLAIVGFPTYWFGKKLIEELKKRQ